MKAVWTPTGTGTLSLDFFFEFRYQFNYDMKKREKELVPPKEPQLNAFLAIKHFALLKA